MSRNFLITAITSIITATSSFAQEAPKDMKLFLLIGQSNMAGRGKVEEQDKVENPNIFMLTKELKWILAKDPVHFDKSAAGVGLCSEFARDVLKADPKATIGLISCAVGGSPLDQWQPDKGFYKTAVSRAKEATKQGKLAGILWHQGESDNKPEQIATYPARFETMMTQLRKDLGAENVPLLIGEVIPGFGKHNDINIALAETAKKTPNCVLVSSADLGKKQLHYNSADSRPTP